MCQKVGTKHGKCDQNLCNSKQVNSRCSPCPQVYISSKQWGGPDMAHEGARRNIRRLPAFQGLKADGSVLFAQGQVRSRRCTICYGYC